MRSELDDEQQAKHLGMAHIEEKKQPQDRCCQTEVRKGEAAVGIARWGVGAR